MKKLALLFFTSFFVKTYLYKFWEIINNISLRGMGVGNVPDQISSSERSVLNKLLTKYSIKTVFDVGANEGNYSLNILEKLPNALIYAFEPHPKTYKILERVLTKYNRFSCFNVAVGNPVQSERSIIKLYDYAINDGSDHASALEDTFLYSHNTNNTVSHEVELISLDSFCLGNNVLEIDLLKIDTEGFELEVLRGSKNMLADNKIKLIQWEFNSMNAGKVFFLDFWKILHNNFDIYRLFPNGLYKIESYNPKFQEIFHLQNYLAVNKSLNE